MKRRKFLQAAGIGAAAGTGVLSGRTGAAASSATGRRAADVVVVGAGVFGVWTAYHLRRRGAAVILIDAYGPGNSRSSSGGETRQIQIDHENPVYVRSGIAAFAWWQQMAESSGTTLVLETGKLALATGERLRGNALALAERLRGHGVDNVEILAPDEIRARWPQIRSDDVAFGVYSSGGASGSTLMARRGCQVVAEAFQQLGGELEIADGRPVFDSAGRVEAIRTAAGDIVRGAHYVFACGPWLPALFPELLAERLNVQRRDVLFYGPPPGDHRFSYPHLPCWSVMGSGWYGFPDIEGRGLKAAPYPDYNPLDPDNDERLVSPRQVKRGREFLRHRFPAMGAMPVLETRVCQVTNSADRNFIVDRHPQAENAWIVGAGSGHGYKHGPTVGDFAARLVLDLEADDEYRHTFRIPEETST